MVRKPSGTRAKAKSKSATQITLSSVVPKPVLLIRGKEGALADRIVSYLRMLVLQENPETEVSQLSATGYQPGQLSLWTSPSLFGDKRMIIIDGVELASTALIEDLTSYIASPEDDVCLVLKHRGGNQNRKIVDRVKASEWPVLLVDEIRSDNEKIALVNDEASRLGGRFTGHAAQQIVDAVGKDLYELLGMVRQLLVDNGGEVTEAMVKEFFTGRVETTGFEVADAVAAGEGPKALLLARRAFASGVDPVPIVAVIAMKLREIAKATVPGVSTKDMGMPPWRAEQVRTLARMWHPHAIGAAICLVANADVAVKGGSRDSRGAVEKCIIEISRIRSQAR